MTDLRVIEVALRKLAGMQDIDIVSLADVLERLANEIERARLDREQRLGLPPEVRA